MIMISFLGPARYVCCVIAFAGKCCSIIGAVFTCVLICTGRKGKVSAEYGSMLFTKFFITTSCVSKFLSWAALVLPMLKLAKGEPKYQYLGEGVAALRFFVSE